VGLVAPADRKAVYMGYAFLYGVIGSLVGSNLGAAMYESMLKPLVGQTGISTEIRNFWLIFAALDVVAVAGLVVYNRFFAEETDATNRLARRIMIVIYAGLIVLGAYFFYSSTFAAETTAFRTLVQSLIMLGLGVGGLIISAKRR
jgi:hypothetical protein